MPKPRSSDVAEHGALSSLATILLIDDNPVQLRAREAVLRSSGYEVHTATTVESALALLRGQFEASQIHTIITDHIMPEASGVEFVRALRRLHPVVPVIVITGAAEAESDYQGLNIIFRQKPCPPEELLSLVRSALRAA